MRSASLAGLSVRMRLMRGKRIATPDLWRVDRFGPVREVEKALVLEVAFDSIHKSTRHKSGLAMRFPRISRIRTDKPANEADLVETLKRMAT